jgi:hypothetical protein|tara:strand:- start:37 stop:192 length:156 start_codon:yes stop_codon:yes gene_type:complete
MQINLVKYYLTLNTFKKELRELLDTQIPEGYEEVNAKVYKKENGKDQNSKL